MAGSGGFGGTVCGWDEGRVNDLIKIQVNRDSNRRKGTGKRTRLRSATRLDAGVCFSSARFAISTRTEWRGAGMFHLVCCSFL